MSESVLERPRLAYEDIDQAFPAIEAGLTPFGSRILVQMRSPKARTTGGIILPDDAQDTEFWNTQVAKVVSLGPVAFKNRDTLESWPEDAWCQEGDFVRVPKYGGDRWFVTLPGAKSARVGVEKACFALFNDLDMIGQITCDPLEVIAYL